MAGNETAATAATPAPAAGSATATSNGLLSMVGTPIGNLSDAAPRVVDTLAAADVVLCEDTRVTSKLLARFGIRVPLERCDENVIASRVESVMGRLDAGERVAFVSDAGMPGVSDPGQRLVDAALDAGHKVEVIPGPSAVTCALVASGLPMEHFYFEGFLPRRAGEQCRRLRELALVPGALVAYESPYRVAATLANIAEVMPGRQVALVRELTKVHEEVLRGAAPELAGRVAECDAIKGECVVVIGAPEPDELERRFAEMARERGLGVDAPASPDDTIREGLAAGEPKSKLAKRVAKAFGLDRATAYDRVVELSHEAE